MTTKIAAGVLLIIALAAAGTVGVGYMSDCSCRHSAAPGMAEEPSCGLEMAPSCPAEPKPCCNMPPREELLKDSAGPKDGSD